MYNITIPTSQEWEETFRFRTYLNYVCSISNYLFSIKPAKFLIEITSSKAFQHIQCKKITDEKIEKLLRNSWLTEVKLHLDGEEKDFSSYSNHWAPVQLYYSVYLALRAFFISSGTSITGEHVNNLSAISDEIVRRPDLFPYPFKTVCIDCGALSPEKFVNWPDGIPLNTVSTLQNY